MTILTRKEAEQLRDGLYANRLEHVADAIAKAIADHHVITVSGIDIGRFDTQTGGEDDQG